jgi:hypothetical protein
MFVTRNEPAALPRGDLFFSHKRAAAASVLVAASVALSSAPAQAGFGYFSVDNLSETTPASATEQPANVEFKLPSIVRNPHAELAGNHSISSNSDIQVYGVGGSFSAGDPISQVNNAIPPTSPTPPLLIPVPTAISSGLCGLIILALLATPRWIRRRLF